MNILRYTALFSFCFFPFTSISATLEDSYIDGPKKVCVYDDGSKVYVGVADQCPRLKI